MGGRRYSKKTKLIKSEKNRKLQRGIVICIPKVHETKKTKKTEEYSNLIFVTIAITLRLPIQIIRIFY